ncbi:toll-like receptor 13 [Parasteatoda tepidariorum]|uniref:toll-like receptor 13 n=1 Tax=Parasteatoda tepidariorum TaxID=114398 RepID=UPI001C71A733|nr:toll-like receptor 13 [Parasteatoda tepidariorum]
MGLECSFLMCFIVISFCIAEGALLITDECRVYDRSDEFGKAAFCTQFISNLTSYSLPLNTTRLQIYRTYNLSQTLPLAPNLNMLTTLELPNDNLVNVSSGMFEGLYNLTVLSLANNRILKLPEGLFKNNLYISRIDLTRNYLLSFEACTVALKNLKYLTDINLSGNKLLRNIFQTETDVLGELTIQKLDISDCAIEVIEIAAFENFHSLSFLDISMNPLSEKAMKNLSQGLNLSALKEFRATDMKFTAYFSNSFLNRLKWTNIEKLDLSNNKFTSFPRGHFPHLKELIINNCVINVLMNGSISDMPRLEVLTIQKHQISHIGNIFHNNRNLISLDLSEYVTFTIVSRESATVDMTIEDYSFKYLKNLETLILRKTPLRGVLRRFMLFGLTNLTKLDFFNCAFESIQENAFETLSSLRSLDLSFNIIFELPDKAFYGLKNLKNLDLSRNRLTFLKSSELLNHTPKLELLNLNRNKIQSLSIKMFSKLHSIEMIQVSENQIQPWNKKLFQNNPNLTIFIFSENYVNYFTREMLQDISYLTHVDFSKNPFDCSFCSTVELQSWMNDTNVTISNLQRELHSYDCYSPESLKEQSLMDVNLSDLELKCVPYIFDFIMFAYSLISCCIFITFIVVAVWYKWKWNIRYIAFRLRTRTKRFKENVKRFEFDAFVSYCEKDFPWVINQLIPAIEENDPNIVLCLLDRDLCAGNSIFDSINSAVEQSRTTILVLSNAYMNSNWNVFETQIAQSKLFEDMRGGLILIFLEPIQKLEITKNLRYVIKTRTCLQWTKNATGQKLFWERLKMAIKKPEDKGISTHIT